MNQAVFSRLHAGGLISDDSFEKIKSRQNEPLSVHWEIKSMLYLGVLLFSTGVGILIYENIDTIGHQVILAIIALVFTGGFYYCLKNKLPFSVEKVEAPGPFFDYILLLSCCTFITFIAYLQFQYNLFGTRYGLASFLPMVVLFFSAYYFDHLGVLSMAIVNLAAWLGITVAPLRILGSNDFSDSVLIYTGLVLGALLVIVSRVTKKRNIKKHFAFTYANFGTHILLISCLAALFYFNAYYLPWFLLLVALVYFFYGEAMKERSFYFLLVVTLYAYIGTSYVVLYLLSKMGVSNSLAPIYLAFLYFIFSGIGLVFFLKGINKKLKQHDSI